MIRDAAAGWLRYQMKNSSRKLTWSSWDEDWEYNAWLATPPDFGKCSPQEPQSFILCLKTLRRLGEALGGWWILAGDGLLTWEPMDSWLVMVEEWQRKQQAQQGKDGG